VEEELKHQRDILIDLKKEVNYRFEMVDKRFVLMQWLIMVGFVTLGTLVSVIKIFG